jgi:hypothetical protein
VMSGLHISTPWKERGNSMLELAGVEFWCLWSEVRHLDVIFKHNLYTSFSSCTYNSSLWHNLLIVFWVTIPDAYGPFKTLLLNSWNNSNHWNTGQNLRSIKSQILLWLVSVASYLPSDLSEITFSVVSNILANAVVVVIKLKFLTIL